MTQPSPPSTTTAPPALVVAAALVGVEGLVLLALGVAELSALRTTRMTMGVTTAGFFLVFGAGLAACAWALVRVRRWGRGPALMAQLIALLLAWSFWGEGTRFVSVCLVAAGAVGLAGLLHPSSVAALEGGAEHSAG